MILIKNGRIIDPHSKRDEVVDIVIRDNKILKIGKCSLTDEYEKVIDASGCIVAPGLIDVHVHFRDPGFTHKEDIETGSKSAAKGGFTTVVCMANTNPIVDNEETLEYIKEKAKTSPINVLQACAITKGFKGKELVDMKYLKECGAVGFTDDGLPIMDSDVIYNVAEDVMVARDCMRAIKTGAKVNIQHISSGVSVETVRMAKKLGANVYAEATPHHFTLTEEDVLNYGTNAKMNPPLRTENDKLKIIEGLQDGTIEIIATDHAPHTYEEKNVEFAKSPSGIVGLETALALGITNLVKKGYLSMMTLLEKMTINPAKLYNLDCGFLKEGSVADLVIFNPNESYKVSKFESKSFNSPFIGHELYGKINYTICRGKIVFDGMSK